MVVNNHTCPAAATHVLDGYAGHDVVRLCDACFDVVRAYEQRKKARGE